MKSIIVGPASLAPGAMLPQCLDLHFTADSVFERMATTGSDYATPGIARLRARDALREYRRALVYSRQVVVNRAFFFSPTVFQDFENARDGNNSRLAFGGLVESGAIVPYLLKERNLFDDSDALQNSARSVAAVQSLAELLPSLTCVRLDVYDKINATLAERLAQSFRAFCVSIGQLRHSRELLNLVAAEVFRDAIDQDAFELFARSLQQMAEYANQATTLNRQVMYGQFLLAPGTTHHQGRFRDPRTHPMLMAQKKLLDLRYNTSLPDLLGRFTVTPMGLPSHAAIDCIVPGPVRTEDGGEALLSELRRRIANTFVDRAQETFVLPPLDAMTIEDVTAARALPEWQTFIELQERILREPLRCLEYLEEFGKALTAFQTAFSKWYHREPLFTSRREKQYGVVVSIAVKVLSFMLLKAFGNDATVASQVGVIAAAALPERTYGFLARLVVDFVDVSTGRVDSERGYSLDLYKSAMELTREDIVDLLTAFSANRRSDSNAGAPAIPAG